MNPKKRRRIPLSLSLQDLIWDFYYKYTHSLSLFLSLLFFSLLQIAARDPRGVWFSILSIQGGGARRGEARRGVFNILTSSLQPPSSAAALRCASKKKEGDRSFVDTPLEERRPKPARRRDRGCNGARPRNAHTHTTHNTNPTPLPCARRRSDL